MKAPANYVPVYACRTCFDEPSGWAIHHGPTRAETYAYRCACWGNNPEVKRRKAMHAIRQTRAQAEQPRGRR